MRCPRCRFPLADGLRLCPACGHEVGAGHHAASDDPTSAPSEATTRARRPETPDAGTSRQWGPGTRTDERFVPGTVVEGRYRITGLLGRGGMGEVYRADDLKLGQPVALKFLSRTLADDPDRLERLHEEVRTARRVAHPNTCRMYDIGDADGHPFLSMEFVDGEDLAALLLRIGRLPRDKAAQLARQICAGLAAAHAQGVVHRDLKPANIMIDGRGRARITDFGLARQARVIDGVAALEGTPRYMAPEQLAGREATVRSDVYALGLVLYELFTGRRAFEASTPADALAERSAGLPSSPAEYVDTLDPVVARAILRCLEPEPALRPGSALEVAAALPGGDPLAAALEAGETPSPDLVAAAPAGFRLRPAWAGALVAVCLAATLGGQWLHHRFLLAPDGRPPVVLANRAAEILEGLGHPTAGHDTAWGYGRPATPGARPMFDREMAEQMVSGAAPPYFTFWFRSAPFALMPEARMAVSPHDPPRAVAGSALVQLSTNGDLLGLEVWSRGTEREVSPVVGEEAAAPEPWPQLLAFANLDPTELQPVETRAAPPMFATRTATWEGRYAGGLTRRVEAAAVDGRVVWLRVYSPEQGEPGLVLEALPEVFLALLYVLFLAAMLGGVWLARSNLRTGRGDRRGAWRVGLVVGGTWLIAFALRADHAPTVAEFVLVYRLLAGAVLMAVLTGVFYLGLEPLLRRHWPHRIVGWSRAVDGRLGDPLVGRDVFVAAVVASIVAPIDSAGFLLGQAAGARPRVWSVLVPEGTGWQIPDILASWPLSVSLGVLQGLGFAVILLLAVRTLRRESVGAVAVGILMVFGLVMRDQAHDPWVTAALVLQITLILTVFMRWGLLATVACIVLANLSIMPATRFADSWLTSGSTVVALTTPLLAACGAWAATRPRAGGTSVT